MAKKIEGSRAWYWAAACACEERRASGEPWGEGDHNAEVLLARVLDPGRLAEALADRFGRIDLRSPKPRTANDWRDLADRMWEAVGLSLDLNSVRPGQTLDVTPYHLWLETDPERPWFHRRVLRPPDPQLAMWLRRVGRNFRAIVAVPGDDLPVVLAGRGRTKAARHGNHETLNRLVAELYMESQPLMVPPPQILGLGPVPLRREEGLELLGLLRVEIVDPASALAVHAANADNDGQEPETALSNARQVRQLRELGLRSVEIAAAKRVTTDTIANWDALLQLTPTLQDLLDAGELSEAEGYRLGRIPQVRQLEVYEKTRHGKSVAERVSLINALAKGRQAELPASPAKPQPPRRKQVTRAVERLRGLPPAPPTSAQAGARAVLRLMAGDAAALDGLPDEVAAEVRGLLAD